MAYFIYILANRKHGTLYIGITNDVARRIWEHRQGLGSRFVKRYGVTRLVYVELHDEIAHAIQRGKKMKEWPRAWKLRLTERDNPVGDDIYDRLNGHGIGSRKVVQGRNQCVRGDSQGEMGRGEGRERE